MGSKSILDKVNYILQAAINKDDSPECLLKLHEYTEEHTDHMILGRVWGWSVSDYAIAAMKWIGTKEANALYSEITGKLPEHRKLEIEKLISSELYKQY